MTRGQLYLGLLAGWVALTLTLTSIPNLHVGPDFRGADKIAHFTFYGIMGFLFVLWRREIGKGAVAAVICAAIFAALLGLIDEFHQQWIPGRSMDLLDWTADFLGGTAGSIFSSVAASRLPFLLTPRNPPFSGVFKN